MDLCINFETQSEERAKKQYDKMLKALQLVGERKGWSVHLVIIVGGTLGSVNNFSSVSKSFCQLQNFQRLKLLCSFMAGQATIETIENNP